MPRPRSAPGGRPHVVAVRLSGEENELLDRYRGSVDRGAFLRWLLQRHTRSSEPLSDARQVLDRLRGRR